MRSDDDGVLGADGVEKEEEVGDTAAVDEEEEVELESDPM